jgi:hypothetical protein
MRHPTTASGVMGREGTDEEEGEGEVESKYEGEGGESKVEPDKMVST